MDTHTRTQMQVQAFSLTLVSLVFCTADGVITWLHERLPRRPQLQNIPLIQTQVLHSSLSFFLILERRLSPSPKLSFSLYLFVSLSLSISVFLDDGTMVVVRLLRCYMCFSLSSSRGHRGQREQRRRSGDREPGLLDDPPFFPEHVPIGRPPGHPRQGRPQLPGSRRSREGEGGRRGGRRESGSSPSTGIRR